MPVQRHLTAVVVVAAGRGTRAAGGCGRPGDCPSNTVNSPASRCCGARLPSSSAIRDVDQVVAVIHVDDLDRYYREATTGLAAKLLEPAIGGSTRQASVLAGLEDPGQALPVPPTWCWSTTRRDHSPTNALITGWSARRGRGRGAIAAVPVADTLKRTDRSGVIIDTVDRSSLWRAQTPQAFHLDDLLAAHGRRRRPAATISPTMRRSPSGSGLEVTVVTGSEQNRKLTTDDDILLADRHLRAEAALAAGETRSATGFDVHRTMPGDHLMLCGVRIAADFTLEGHSDADVALHALTDAVLGTIGADDIGVHFPPSDSRWRGASSDLLPRPCGRTAARARRRTVAARRHHPVRTPEDRPVPPRRCANGLLRSRRFHVERVSIKATTTERLGFTGRGEGIAALATATVRLPF